MSEKRWPIPEEMHLRSALENEGYPPERIEEIVLAMNSHVHLKKTNEALVEALAALIDGVDSNVTGECEGLSAEEWDKRIKKAKETLKLADQKEL